MTGYAPGHSTPTQIPMATIDSIQESKTNQFRKFTILLLILTLLNIFSAFKSELDQIVNMDRIPNYSVFENFMNTEYQIIWFLKMNEYRISNSTIRSQLSEYQILKIG